MDSHVPPAIQGFQGIQLIIAYHLIVAAIMLVFLFLADNVGERLTMMIATLLYGWIAYALFSVRKNGWHLARIVSFITVILNAVAVACAPEAIADGDGSLALVALDILVLLVNIQILAYLRRPLLREIYGVPEFDADADGPG